MKRIRGVVELNRKKWHYDENPPWTTTAQEKNLPSRHYPFELLEPIADWKIFKGDRVEVLTGKDKGKQGIVQRIVKERNWIFVDGLNCKYELTIISPGAPARLFKNEQPLLVNSEVKLVDPGDRKPTEVEWRFTEQGAKIRVATRSGRPIPLPREADTLPEGVDPKIYLDSEKDTRDSDLTVITFKPKLTTFEQDIMDSMGIKETRMPAKTYWY